MEWVVLVPAFVYNISLSTQLCIKAGILTAQTSNILNCFAWNGSTEKFRRENWYHSTQKIVYFRIRFSN